MWSTLEHKIENIMLVYLSHKCGHRNGRTHTRTQSKRREGKRKTSVCSHTNTCKKGFIYGLAPISVDIYLLQSVFSHLLIPWMAQEVVKPHCDGLASILSRVLGPCQRGDYTEDKLSFSPCRRSKGVSWYFVSNAVSPIL